MLRIIAVPFVLFFVVLVGLLILSYGFRKNGNTNFANELCHVAEEMINGANAHRGSYIKSVVIRLAGVIIVLDAVIIVYMSVLLWWAN